MVEKSEFLLSNIDSNEDASVYKISDDLALVQTLDFITPVVNDPFVFGEIAAANSLSDVFAMGANVLNALNIIGFDGCHFDKKVLAEILQGGKSKIIECGGKLVGGHSIETPEMYYGLSVTGIVHPDKFWSNNTAKPNDVLILTKPLGFGVLSTAIKADFLNLDEIKEAASYMKMLNFYALDALKDIKVTACTDITGFGLFGHAIEMINDNISMFFDVKKIPILKSAVNSANFGLIPAGAYRNLEFIKKHINKEPDILFCDPQTSGGFLISVDEKDANKALVNLKNSGYEKASIIGVVKHRGKFKIEIN